MSEDHYSDDEPTQPLTGGPVRPSPIPPPTHAGWGPPPPSGGWAAPPPPPPTRPLVEQAPPSPAPLEQQPLAQQPLENQPLENQPRPERRSLSLPAWLGVAGVSLVLGLVGGIAGVALQDGLQHSEPGRNNAGLEGVRTQEAAPLDADNGSIPSVADALLPSTVQIIANFGGAGSGATGSGFVLDRDGHIVTNNHVVAGAAGAEGRIVVVDHEGERHEADVVGRSGVYDLAVLHIEGGGELEPAALGASQVLRVGDQVIAFGSPLGLSQTVTSGIVSALGRPVTTTGEGDDDTSYINAVQTDAAINPGNSGGPLVNLAGEVVGVNSAIATTGGSFGGESGNIGVGFAIPIEQVRTTVDQILRTGEAQYPVIGAQVSTGGDNNADSGALITAVNDNSPAARAGLRQDDVVVAVDGELVTDGIALIVAIRTHVPGEEIELTVVRNGRERPFVLELDGEVG